MSGLGYCYQNQVVLVGSKSSSGTLTRSTLTAAYDVAANTKAFTTGNMSKVNFSISYKLGTGETSNVLNMRIRTSQDNVTYYQIVNETVSAGTSTLTQREFQFTGANDTAAYNFSLPIDIQDKWMEISFNESGVATNFGSVFCEVNVSGAE